MKSRMALVVCIVAMAFFTAPALAAGPYVGGEAGAVFLSTSTFTDPGGDFDLKTKTGFGLGLLGGMDFGTYRVEGEFAYRRNNMKEGSDSSGTTSLGGDYSSMALMVNGYYDFRMVSPTVVPYIGGGLGGARLSLKVTDPSGSTFVDDSDIVFAYQFAAGVGFPISNQLTLDLGYKYFATANPSFEPIGGGTTVDGEYASHNLFLGARFSF